MLNLVVTIITVFANLFLAIIVLRQSSKKATHVIFGVLTIIISLWAIFNYFSLSTSNPYIALIWIRVVMATVAVMLTTIYLLASSFPYPMLRISKWKLGFVIVETVVIFFIANTPLVFSSVAVNGETVSPIPGKGIIFFGLHALVYIALSVYTLIVKRRKEQTIYKNQVNLMLIGFILTFVTSFFTTFIFVAVLKNSNFVVFGPLYSLFLVGCTGYAIVRHRLLDINSLIARAATYTFLLILLVGLEMFLAFAITEILPGSLSVFSIVLISSILIVASYDWMREQVAVVTEKYLYQENYNSEEVLSKLTRIMASEINLDELSKKLCAILAKRMKLTRVAFVLKGEEGTESQFWKELSTKTQNKNELIFDELEEGETKKFMRENNLSFVIKLSVKDSRIGYLIAGPKASGDVYFDKDIELLRLFAPNAAVALNNAKNYREISRFSRTLEKKVEERTRELEVIQREKLKKASELLKLKDEFVFIATHDLASPITAISGYADLIRTSKERMSKNLRENMDEIVAGASRLKDLVDDLLQVARNESGTIKVSLSEVDLAEVVEAVASQVAPRAKSKDVYIDLKLDAKHRMVMADRDKLMEVFENLFTNAIKYNKEGGKVTVRSRVEGGSMLIEVADTGYGIPKGEQDKVFSKFFRSESQKIRTESGTGLGLFVVRMLVTKMGGKISFVSEENKGTCFTIILKATSHIDK